MFYIPNLVEEVVEARVHLGHVDSPLLDTQKHMPKINSRHSKVYGCFLWDPREHANATEKAQILDFNQQHHPTRGSNVKVTERKRSIIHHHLDQLICISKNEIVSLKLQHVTFWNDCHSVISILDSIEIHAFLHFVWKQHFLLYFQFNFEA